MIDIIRLSKRRWLLVDVTEDSSKEVFRLELMQSSITNKFVMVKDLISELNELYPETFSKFYIQLLETYIDSNLDENIILNNIGAIINIATEYVDSKNIDYSTYIKEEKTSKTSIVFNEADIRELFIVSTSMKLYSIYRYDIKLKVSDNINKRIYEQLIKRCIDLEIIDKLYKLLRARIYKSNISNIYIWELIKISISETPDTYVLTIFNFIVNNIIPLIIINKNPIPFLVTIVEDKVRWLMRTVYRNRTVYGEVYGGNEDMMGDSIGKESFHLYCCRDLIVKTVDVAFDIIENELNLTDDNIELIKDRIKSIDCILPHVKIIVLPIASKVLEIPYNYLVSMPPSHSILLGIVLSHISKGLLDIKYPLIHEFLESVPKNSDVRSISVRSSYKIRNINKFINTNTGDFIGFKNDKCFGYSIITSLCGVLLSSKKDLLNAISGRDNLIKFNTYEVESNCIEFYSRFYSNNNTELTDVFTAMSNKLDKYIN